MTARPRPAAYMPLATRLLDSGVVAAAHRALLDEVGIAGIDQLRAAHSEAEALVLRTASMLGREAKMADRFSPRAFAWQIAVARAVLDRVTTECEHHPNLGEARVVVTSLTHRARACRDCLAAGLVWPPAVDDGRCDVCDRPETYFHEFVTQIGGEYVGGNLCRSCYRFSRRAVVA